MLYKNKNILSACLFSFVFFNSIISAPYAWQNQAEQWKNSASTLEKEQLELCRRLLGEAHIAVPNKINEFVAAHPENDLRSFARHIRTYLKEQHHILFAPTPTEEQTEGIENTAFITNTIRALKSHPERCLEICDYLSTAPLVPDWTEQYRCEPTINLPETVTIVRATAVPEEILEAKPVTAESLKQEITTLLNTWGTQEAESLEQKHLKEMATWTANSFDNDLAFYTRHADVNQLAGTSLGNLTDLINQLEKKLDNPALFEQELTNIISKAQTMHKVHHESVSEPLNSLASQPKHIRIRPEVALIGALSIAYMAYRALHPETNICQDVQYVAQNSPRVLHHAPQALKYAPALLYNTSKDGLKTLSSNAMQLYKNATGYLDRVAYYIGKKVSNINQ